MLAILGALPVIGNIVTAITSALFNAKVEITRARIGGNRDVAVKLVEAAAQKDHEDTTRLGIFASNKFLTLLLVAAAVPLVSYEFKVYVWDAMLGWGTTDPVKGQVAEWGNTVWYFLFGSPTVMGIAKIWFARDRAT